MRSTAITHKRYADLIKEGRGQGRGRYYIPWLYAARVTSMGKASEIRGRITGRDHQLLSDIERAAFHTLDRRHDVLDIREGLPLLPVEFTWDLASDLGVRVPYRTSTKFHVMTTDFVISYEDRQLAVAVKSEEQFVTSSRVGELLAIEQAYWKEVGVDFEIWTNDVLTSQMLYTLDVLYAHRRLPDEISNEIARASYSRLCDALYDVRSIPLTQLCLALDARCKLPPVTHYNVLMHFAYCGTVVLDLQRRFSEFEPHTLRNDVLMADVRRSA